MLYCKNNYFLNWLHILIIINEYRTNLRMVCKLIIFRVVKSPKVYPGLHQETNPRTSEAFKPLEPKSQVLISYNL